MEDATSDEQLLVRIGSGDKTAFWEAWLRHEQYIKQICRQIGGDEDDIHDVMLKLMAKLPIHASRVSNLKAWMGKLAQNFCIDRYRSLRRQTNIVSLNDVDLAHPQAVSNEPILHSNSVELALAKMPAGMREAFGLRFFKGFSYRQIAEQLQMPEASIRKRIERARRRLHQEFGESVDPRLYPERDEHENMTGTELQYFCSFLKLVPVVLESGIEIDLPVTTGQIGHRPELTIEMLRKQVQQSPGAIQKHLKLGQLLYSTGKWHEAIEEHRHILRKRPNLVSIWMQLGKMLLVLGRRREGAAAYSRAAEAKPGRAMCHYLQAMIALCNHEYRIALRMLEDAISLDSRQMGFWWTRLNIYWMTGDLQENISTATHMLDINPLDVNARISCCHALCSQGREQEAEYHAMECLKSDPGNVMALKYLSWLRCTRHLVQGDEGSATLRMIRLMLQKTPRSPEAHEALAQFYVCRGQFKKGLAVLRDFVSDYPNKPFGWLYYSFWLFQTGDTENGEQALAKVRTLYPGWCFIKEQLDGTLSGWWNTFIFNTLIEKSPGTDRLPRNGKNLLRTATD